MWPLPSSGFGWWMAWHQTVMTSAERPWFWQVLGSFTLGLAPRSAAYPENFSALHIALCHSAAYPSQIIAT